MNSTCLYNGFSTLIFPITLEETEMLINDRNEFSKYINVNYDCKDNVSVEQLNRHIAMQMNNEKDWEWGSIWLVVDVHKRAIIGTMNFKNIPNENQSVEIEYKIDEKYQSLGHCTSAVKLLLEWIFSKDVLTVFATSKKDNVASNRVLAKNGFVAGDEGENYIWIKEKV